MRLKCVAAIASLYLQSQETSVIETSFLHRLQAEESRGYNFFSSEFSFRYKGIFPVSFPSVIKGFLQKVFLPL